MVVPALKDFAFFKPACDVFGVPLWVFRNQHQSATGSKCANCGFDKMLCDSKVRIIRRIADRDVVCSRLVNLAVVINLGDNVFDLVELSAVLDAGDRAGTAVDCKNVRGWLEFCQSQTDRPASTADVDHATVGLDFNCVKNLSCTVVELTMSKNAGSSVKLNQVALVTKSKCVTEVPNLLQRLLLDNVVDDGVIEISRLD